jgi:hypothetical protein
MALLPHGSQSLLPGCPRVQADSRRRWDSHIADRDHAELSPERGRRAGHLGRLDARRFGDDAFSRHQSGRALGVRLALDQDQEQDQEQHDGGGDDGLAHERDGGEHQHGSSSSSSSWPRHLRTASAGAANQVVQMNNPRSGWAATVEPKRTNRCSCRFRRPQS